MTSYNIFDVACGHFFNNKPCDSSGQFLHTPDTDQDRRGNCGKIQSSCKIFSRVANPNRTKCEGGVFWTSKIIETGHSNNIHRRQPLTFYDGICELLWYNWLVVLIIQCTYNIMRCGGCEFEPHQDQLSFLTLFWAETLMT